MQYADLIRVARSRVSELDPATLRSTLESRNPRRPVILDVREAEDTRGGIIPGSSLLPRGLVEKHISDLVPDAQQPIVVVCEAGNRSALVADVLGMMGYSDVKSLAGGIQGWIRTGAALEPGETTIRSGAGCHALDWGEIRAEFPIVGRRVPVVGGGERQLVYLDHAASTHSPACVLERYSSFMAGEYANIHRGTHLLSRNATELFDECYYVVADFIGGDLDSGSVVFLTNTTQAIDLCAHVMDQLPGAVVVSELEHHSNDLPHRKRGPVLRARVREDGSLDMDHLEELLQSNRVKLVALTGGSNVTGFMPDVHAAARLAHEHGALIMLDAAQLLAHDAIDIKPDEHPEHIDFLAAAGHKAYAPFGASFLYGPRAVMDAAPPYLPGGGTASAVGPRSAEYVRSPDRHQGGTPNIGGVIAMAESLKFLDRIGMDRVRAHELEILEDALGRMAAIEGVTVYGPHDASRRLGVISFNIEGVSDLQAAAVMSEERGLACRNGRFCAHVYMDKLLAYQGGVTKEPGSSPGAVRASFGLYNTLEDVDAIEEAVRMIRDRRWVGRYRVKDDSISTEFAGRCNDRWMEAAQPAPEETASDALLFEQLNPLPTTCRAYLIADPKTKRALIVDPRRDRVDHYLSVLERHGLQLVLTLETATHVDHLSGSKRLKDVTGCKMAMHETSGAPCVDMPLADGAKLSVGELSIEVWSVPGRAHDALALVIGDRVLVGDLLLTDSIPAPDLARQLRCSTTLHHQSLQRLKSLPNHFTIWPAHNERGMSHTTVGEQVQTHPAFAGDAAAFAMLARSQATHAEPQLAETIRANQRCLV